MTDASVQGGMKVNQSEVRWFVNCVIFNVTAKLLVDSGASISMIDVKLFQKAPLTLRSSLKPINVWLSVVEWLKHRTDDQHGLGSKSTCAILLCSWERHFTALSPAWWS